MLRSIRKYNLILILIPLVLFQSCGDKENLVEQEEITLTFWHSMVSSSVPALKELLDKFEKEHPGIKIEEQYIPSGNALLYKLVTAVQSKNTPDISWIYAGSYKDLVEADAIYSIDHFMKSDDEFSNDEIEDMYEGLIPLASWKDTMYSLPMEATNFALLYNRDMFSEAGLDPDSPPKNWQELYDYSVKLSLDKNGNGRLERPGILLPVYPAAGPLGGYMVWQWVPFLWQAGGYVTSLDQKQALFSSDAGVRALDYWKKIFDELNLKNFSADHDMAFASELTAMIFDGPWNLPQYKKTLNNIRWSVAPLPVGPAKAATNTGGEFLVIFKQTDHPKEAWEFLKWILKPETQAFWSMKSGYLPVRRSVLKIKEYQEFLEENPNLKIYVEQMDVAQSRRSLDYNSMQIDRILAEAIEKATIGRMSSEKALKEAAEKADKILKNN